MIVALGKIMPSHTWTWWSPISSSWSVVAAVAVSSWREREPVLSHLNGQKFGPRVCSELNCIPLLMTWSEAFRGPCLIEVASRNHPAINMLGVVWSHTWPFPALLKIQSTRILNCTTYMLEQAPFPHTKGYKLDVYDALLLKAASMKARCGHNWHKHMNWEDFCQQKLVVTIFRMPVASYQSITSSFMLWSNFW